LILAGHDALRQWFESREGQRAAIFIFKGEETMAEITNGCTGPGQLAVRIDILDRVQGMGMVFHGPIMMNVGLGVLRAEVSFWVGEREIYEQEVWLHRMSVEGWSAAVKALISGQTGECKKIVSGPESPELRMAVRRYDSTLDGPASEGVGPCYDLLVTVDSVVLGCSIAVTGQGPAMCLVPTAGSLLQFANDLRVEADNALLHPGHIPQRLSEG
jgi:hypothetical protein